MTRFPLLLPFLAAGCAQSPLQPSISDRSYVPADATSIAPIGAAPAPAPAAAAPSPVTCTRVKGHDVYYGGSTVSLHFSCDAALTGVAVAGAPTFLKATAAGKIVSIDGVAPGAASTTTWSFVVNGLATLGDATKITTTVITSTPSVTLKAPNIDPTASFGASLAIDFNTVALDPAWDGSTNDVTLSLLPATPAGGDLPADFNGQAFAAADGDALSLTYRDDCATATGLYVCPGLTTAAGTTSVNGGGRLLWTWSPFDQGNYALKVRPLLTIEGLVLRMPAATLQFQIPQQTFGQVPLAVTGHPDSAGLFDAETYRYGFALSAKASTPSKPVFGVTYASQVGGAGPKHDYFSRLALDRATNPTQAAPTGVSQAASVDLSLAADASLSRVVALGDGSWAEISLAGGELVYHRIADSGAAPSVSKTITMTAMAGADVILGLDVTAPFVDKDGTTRLGVAYVMQDTFTLSTTVGFGKINPAGTALNGGAPSLDDDADFATMTSDFNAAPTFESDKIAVAAGTVAGEPAAYLAYRDGQQLMIGWLKTNKTGAPLNYDFSTPFADLSAGIVPKPFASPAGADQQSLALALGTSGGKTVAAAAWRESDANAGGPRCFFRRIDGESLAPATLGAVVALSSGPCRLPRLAFHPGSGRFVATYAEQVAGSWKIMTKEIILGTAGASDAAGAASAVASTGVNFPSQLEAVIYPAGNFVGILYRAQGSDRVQVHGYHVSPF